MSLVESGGGELPWMDVSKTGELEPLGSSKRVQAEMHPFPVSSLEIDTKDLDRRWAEYEKVRDRMEPPAGKVTLAEADRVVAELQASIAGDKQLQQQLIADGFLAGTGTSAGTLAASSGPASARKSQEKTRATTKQLTTPQKILIAFLVTLVVVTGVVLLVYFLVIRPKNDSGGGNAGADKFGTIQIRNLTTNTTVARLNKSAESDVANSSPTYAFSPGDELQLIYTASAQGFSGRALWTMSTDGGKTFAVQIADPTFGNVVLWTIPANMFTNSAVFKVSDADNLADFVTTATTNITINPVFVLVNGPGIKHSGDAVFVGTNITCTIQTDLSISGIANVSVSTSKDGRNFSSPTVQTVLSTTPHTSTSTLTVVWTASKAAEDVYYRITTTQLVLNGAPYELSATSPQFIKIIPELSCEGSPPPVPPTAFSICDMSMVENSTGRTNNFDSASAVTLAFSYLNTFPGTASWEYSVGGGAFVAWSVVSGPDTSKSGVVSYQAVLPSVATQNFVVRVTSGSVTMTSSKYVVEPVYVITSIHTGDPVSVYPAGTPNVNVVTTMQMFPNTATPVSWQVGYTNLQGVTVLHPVVSSTAPDPSTGLLTVTWVLTWTDMGLTTIGQSKTRTLVFSADFGGGDVLQRSVPAVVFTAASNTPPLNHAPIQQYGFNLCVASSQTYGPVLAFDPSCTQQWYGKDSKICTWQASSPSSTDVCWGFDNPAFPYQIFPEQDPASAVGVVTTATSGGVTFKANYGAMCVWTDTLPEGLEYLRVDPADPLSNCDTYQWTAAP